MTLNFPYLIKVGDLLYIIQQVPDQLPAHSSILAPTLLPLKRGCLCTYLNILPHFALYYVK
jgi:hypothetical protein